MEKCLFCKIRDGEIPSEKIYQDEKCFIIKDINPKTKLHYLLIPNSHFENLFDISKSDLQNINHFFAVIKKNAKDLGLESGYKIISNQGKYAGQEVPHFHIHILGGEQQ